MKGVEKKDNSVFRYETGKHYRHEYKYLINAKQENVLNIRAMGIMQRDPYVQADGSYLIRSVYFDDIHDTCLKENAAGTDPRSKFRIRYYNSDTGRIFLEKKSKIRGMCLKESCSLTTKECEAILQGKLLEFAEAMPETKKRLLTELRLRGMIPKVIVTYRRVPYIYTGGNVRVTFDHSITSSEDIAHFLTGDYPQRPVLPVGQLVLEVKWDEIIPRHIKDVLQLEGLNWTAFSKYFMCRLHHL